MVHRKGKPEPLLPNKPTAGILFALVLIALAAYLQRKQASEQPTERSGRQTTIFTVGNEWVRQPVPPYPFNGGISTDQEVEIRDLGQGGSLFTLRPDKTLLRDGVKVDPPNFGRLKGLALEFRTTEPGRIAKVTFSTQPK